MNSCQNCSTQVTKLFEMNSSSFKVNVSNIKNGNKIFVCEKCKTYCEERVDKLKNIITSGRDKRLIVAGPGTGKTYTFKEVVDNMKGNKNVLIFTLINNLADELREEFHEPKFKNVKVGTFHGYCKSLLRSKLGNTDAYFPELPIIIEEDSLFLNLGYTKKDYHNALTNIDDDNSSLKFFIKQSSYYKAISHTDSVYKVYKYFSKNTNEIPDYDLIIADEYQDFNELEASFIELISKNNNVLIAGDDDQALYHFRNSSTDFIRNLYYKRKDFEKFDLPFTSRCTKVIEKTIKELIKTIETKGLLKGRIPKDYISYWPEKYIYDQEYKYIQIANCSTTKTSEHYIKNRIEQITRHEKLTGEEKDIQFLIIGSESQFRLNSLYQYLETTLDKNKFSIFKKEDKENINVLFAYRLIKMNKKSNLGWRIMMYVNPPIKAREIIKKVSQDKSSLYGNLPKEYINKFEKDIKDYFEKETEEADDKNEDEVINKKIKVKLTNCLGAKGLSALHVIVTEFHNGVFPLDKNCLNIYDNDIFRCIVALTRAKRSCVLVMFKEYDKKINKTIAKNSCLLNIFPSDCLNQASFRLKRGKLIREN